MLVLTQGNGETVVITLPDKRLIRVTAFSNHGGRVKMGYDAPKDVAVDREVIWQRKRGEVDGNE